MLTVAELEQVENFPRSLRFGHAHNEVPRSMAVTHLSLSRGLDPVARYVDLVQK